MARSTQEWQGKTDDAAIPPRVRLRVFLNFNGRCQCGCSRTIRPGEAWDCDHIAALINGGKHRESNLHPMLREHHKAKTKQDVIEKSKTYRKRAANIGIRKPRSIRAWRKFDGTPVYATRSR